MGPISEVLGRNSERALLIKARFVLGVLRFVHRLKWAKALQRESHRIVIKDFLQFSLFELVGKLRLFPSDWWLLCGEFYFNLLF